MNAQLRELAPSHPYIGGGNVAGILGVSPYKTPYAEYLNIIEGRPQETAEREAFFARRKALEPWAAALFKQKTGLRIVGRNHRYDDAEHPFLKAEIDLELEDGANGEIKTVHPLAAAHWGEPGGDACPVYVTAQAMHGMMIRHDAKRCYVQALIGFDDDRIYVIEKDRETIAAIRAKELEFWQRVQERHPPDAVDSSDILRMFARDAGIPKEADLETALAVERLKELRDELKPLTEEQEQLQERVKLFLADAAQVTVDGVPVATWKSQDSKRFNQAAFAEAYPELLDQFKTVSTTRVFRLK